MSPLRRILEFTVLAGLVLVIVRSLVAPWQVVVSGSMATTLVGPHYQVTCPDCGYSFVCDAGRLPPERAECPNCGFVCTELGKVAAGSRIFVDRAVFAGRGSERWDVVVFHRPDRPAENIVKRVVGLPGETIEIRGGDVYVDGRIARKPIEVQRAMAVLVNDSAFSTQKSNLPSRWSGGRYWQPLLDAVIHSIHPPMDDAPDWLEYHHWRRLPRDMDHVEEVPIRDDDAYNADRSRRLNDVYDLLLVCHIKASGQGTIIWRMTDGRQWFEFRIDTNRGRIELKRDHVLVSETTINEFLLAEASAVEVSLSDQRAVLAINGLVHLSYDYESDDTMRRPTSQPVAIGASPSLWVEISRLQLFRDVYYTDVAPEGARTTVLSPGEYFVLGDNSPVSDDSRSWSPPAIKASWLVGKPHGVR